MLVMDEGRKRVIGIMAAILAARKLCQLDSTRPSPALYSIIADAVIFAERIIGLMRNGQRLDKGEIIYAGKIEYPVNGPEHWNSGLTMAKSNRCPPTRT